MKTEETCSKLLPLAVIAGLLTGCASHAFSPPSRIHRLSSARAIGDGNTSVGAFVGSQAAVFQFGASSAGAHVGYGLNDELSLSADATYSNIGDGEQATVEPHLGSGRLEMKMTPDEGNQHAAVRLGFGGGISEAGSYVAPDVGITIGYDNDIVAPWVDLSGYVSYPIEARSFEYTRSTFSGEETTTVEPLATAGGGAAVGFLVPIEIGEDSEIRWNTGLQATAMYALDGTENTVPFGLGTSLRVVF